jgi:NSS family neurotransmitter:Na+ symporter
MMPLGAILIALFVGWRMKPEVFETELHFSRPWLLRTWVWMLRVVAPLAILGILISGLT